MVKSEETSSKTHNNTEGIQIITMKHWIPLKERKSLKAKYYQIFLKLNWIKGLS